MDENHIADDETLYRSVPNKPSHWVNSEGRPSSAVFKVRDGLSVDRDGGRSEKNVVRFFDERKPSEFGVISVTALQCRKVDSEPIPDPVEGNEYHTEVYNNAEGKDKLTSTQAYKLIDCCQHVRVPDM